jgi:hypothetical protein
VTVTDCDGNVLHSGTTLHGGIAADACIPAALGYHISVGGGSTLANVSWQLINITSGAVVQTGTRGGQWAGDCWCTDGVDDWDIQLLDDWGDGWSGATLDIYDCDNNLLESGLTITGDAIDQNHDICLEPSASGSGNAAHQYVIIAGGGLGSYVIAMA